MKFKIRRTSIWDDNVCPIEGATKEAVLRVDQRTFRTPEDHDKKLGRAAPWLSEGLNHRKNKIGIARDFPSTAWMVEIVSLDGLMKLARDVGQIIVTDEVDWAKGFPEIEIYDGYRE